MTAIHQQGVVEVVGDDFDGHAGLDADAVELGHPFCRNDKSGHGTVNDSFSVCYFHKVRDLRLHGQVHFRSIFRLVPENPR